LPGAPLHGAYDPQLRGIGLINDDNDDTVRVDDAYDSVDK